MGKVILKSTVWNDRSVECILDGPSFSRSCIVSKYWVKKSCFKVKVLFIRQKDINSSSHCGCVVGKHWVFYMQLWVARMDSSSKTKGLKLSIIISKLFKSRILNFAKWVVEKHSCVLIRVFELWVYDRYIAVLANFNESAIKILKIRVWNINIWETSLY